MTSITPRPVRLGHWPLREDKGKDKRRRNKHQPITEAPLLSSDTVTVWSDALDTDDDYFRSPGSPPPTPSDLSSEFSPPSPSDHDTAGEENMISQVKQLQEKCKPYEVLLAKKNESENYFKENLKTRSQRWKMLFWRLNVK